MYGVGSQVQMHKAVTMVSCRPLLAVKIRNDSKYFAIMMEQATEENMWTREGRMNVELEKSNL
jgi:hypothetical protein